MHKNYYSDLYNINLEFCFNIAYNFNQDKCFNRVVKTYETFQKVKNNLYATHF